MKLFLYTLDYNLIAGGRSRGQGAVKGLSNNTVHYSSEWFSLSHLVCSHTASLAYSPLTLRVSHPMFPCIQHPQFRTRDLWYQSPGFYLCVCLRFFWQIYILIRIKWQIKDTPHCDWFNSCTIQKTKFEYWPTGSSENLKWLSGIRTHGL